MNITTKELELIINISRLLNNDQYLEKDLEEIIVLMEDETKLNRNEIYDLIINENTEKLYDNFEIVWTFIDKYDFDNILTLKQKYKEYCLNRIKENQNKVDNDKRKRM